MKKILVLLLGLFLYAQSTWAVPATPYPIEVKQPDGTMLTIRLHGDENYHYTTTVDGYGIVLNKKGYYVYASLKKDMKTWKATCKRAHNAADRTPKEIKFLKKGKVYYQELTNPTN